VYPPVDVINDRFWRMDSDVNMQSWEQTEENEELMEFLKQMLYDEITGPF